MPGIDLDQLRHLEREHFNLLSCLETVQCAPRSQHCELPPMLGWALAVFESFLLPEEALDPYSCK